jgi:hypothetical protein
MLDTLFNSWPSFSTCSTFFALLTAMVSVPQSFFQSHPEATALSSPKDLGGLR